MTNVVSPLLFEGPQAVRAGGGHPKRQQTQLTVITTHARRLWGGHATVAAV